jgi:hypothetical protein
VIIDCDSCEVRGLACGDCVVTALLGAPPGGMEIDDGERAAIDALAGSGLVPPLRLVLSLEPVDPGRAGGGGNGLGRTGESAAAG